jgi:hypothetical protein
MPQESFMLQCVPFLGSLADGGTKQDVRAIYRRPNGDLTSGLPMRRQNQWVTKGLEYVTLADAESLKIAAPMLQAQGLNPQAFVAGIDGDGRPTPWKVDLYLADQKEKQHDADAELRAMIAQYGIETVEAIKGMKVPEHLKHEPVAAGVTEAPSAPEAQKRAVIRPARANVQ